MIKIGITGGIGSGKSVVSSLFEVFGMPVYVADKESKRLSDVSEQIRIPLMALFGPDIYVDGRLDRKRLASHIFSNEKVLRKVNSIIHPVVKEDFEQWCASIDAEACGIESAILYESGFENVVDKVVMVYAPVSKRLARVMERDGVGEAEVIKRMNRQMSDDLKLERADYIIVNDETRPLIPEVEKVLVDILRKQ